MKIILTTQPWLRGISKCRSSPEDWYSYSAWMDIKEQWFMLRKKVRHFRRDSSVSDTAFRLFGIHDYFVAIEGPVSQCPVFGQTFVVPRVSLSGCMTLLKYQLIVRTSGYGQSEANSSTQIHLRFYKYHRKTTVIHSRFFVSLRARR